MGERLQGVEPDILLLGDPSEMIQELSENAMWSTATKYASTW